MKKIFFVMSLICTACVSNFNNNDQSEQKNYCEYYTLVEETPSPSIKDAIEHLRKTEVILDVEDDKG